MNMQSAALGYAKAGLAVFPCWTVLPSENGFICACGKGDCQSKGKHPLGSIVHRGPSEATADIEQVKHWWFVKPDANIGLTLDGFVVVDVDPRHSGDRSLAELETQFGPLPKTRRARTGGGGEHIYFRLPSGVAVKNDNRGGLAPGLDIKTKGGYTLAPPSLHESGNRYAWTDNSPAIEPPAWLIERLQQESAAKPAASPEFWRQLVGEGVSEGSRDASITKLTGHLLRRYIDPHVVFDLMTAWNEVRCRPPLPTCDVFRIVNSICRKEMKRRGND